MESFSSNLREYTKMFKDAGYRFAPENMRDWFTPKKTRMQSCHEKRFFGFKKTAVVLIGVSACGKSTWAKKFLSTHPKFKYISFDECTFKASEEVGYKDVDVSAIAQKYGGGGHYHAAGFPMIGKMQNDILNKLFTNTDE